MVPILYYRLVFVDFVKYKITSIFKHNQLISDKYKLIEVNVSHNFKPYHLLQKLNIYHKYFIKVIARLIKTRTHCMVMDVINSRKYVKREITDMTVFNVIIT